MIGITEDTKKEMSSTSAPTPPGSGVKSKPTHPLEALKKIAPRRVRRRVVTVVGALLGITVAVLVFVPWQQNVIGAGQVMIFSAMDRPQTVEAQIPGRLVEWRVQEGQTVKEGDVIARVEDIDSKFLDPRQPERLKEQRDFAVQGLTEAQRRVGELESQRAELTRSRANAIDAARQAIRQAQAREQASRQALRQTEQSFSIAQKVAVASAKERANQASDRIVQAEQALEAALNQEVTMRQRRERIAGLFVQGLRSKQDDEFAANDLVKAQTDVLRARKSLEIARRDLNVGNLAQSQANIEVERASAVVAAARANLEVAQRDVLNARFNLNRLENDTSASLSRVGADIQSARETVAKNSGDIQKVENDLGNLNARTGQQVVRAPRAGRIVRLMKVGTGSTVKAGDILATIVPDSPDRAVELYLTDNDIPLVSVGRPVRLQFAGWPALQIAGMPGAAIGTFGGRVAFIDPVDDGSSRYRVVIKPDRQRLAGGRMDQAWPDPKVLRPGAEAYGWVMLDTVPLGFELWRQLNAFPPRLPNPAPNALPSKGGEKMGDSYDTKEKDKSLGPVKLRGK